jgi:hypothetical protein
VFSEPGTARQEAERLVAAGLAFASLAASAHPELATGSEACCVCPFCKLIEAVRDPDPQVVERLATGAGDLAVGVASMLRSLSAMAARPSGDAWSAASDPAGHSEPTTSAHRTAERPSAGGASAPARKAAKKAVAKKAVKKTVPRNVPVSETLKDVPPTARTVAAPANPQPKKAVAKKAIKRAGPKPSPGASG